MGKVVMKDTVAKTFFPSESLSRLLIFAVFFNERLVFIYQLYEIPWEGRLK